MSDLPPPHRRAGFWIGLVRRGLTATIGVELVGYSVPVPTIQFHPVVLLAILVAIALCEYASGFYPSQPAVVVQPVPAPAPVAPPPPTRPPRPLPPLDPPVPGVEDPPVPPNPVPLGGSTP